MSVEENILKQVEFYFSEYNLPKDKFLKKTMAENSGWVPLSILLTFSRIRKLSNNDKELLSKSLISSDLLECVDDKVRPKNDVKEIVEDKEKIVTFEGFSKDSTLEKLQEIFPNAKEIRMKKSKKEFTGKVKVTFSTKEEATLAKEKDYDCCKVIEKKSNWDLENKLALLINVSESSPHQIRELFTDFIVKFIDIRGAEAIVRFQDPVADKAIEFYESKDLLKGMKLKELDQERIKEEENRVNNPPKRRK